MAEGKYGAKYGTQYGTQCGTIGLRFYRTEAWIKHEIQDRDSGSRFRIEIQDRESGLRVRLETSGLKLKI